jgi:hypothetical protein
MVNGTEVTTCCWVGIRPKELSVVAARLDGHAPGESCAEEVPFVAILSYNRSKNALSVVSKTSAS